ncbi:hypothetical protein DC28_14190 [Spirochaeta lutea]|uniref:Uncharacterized protein n=2 Tax=Spirochaeta lutea TaxID=1480694 RepID=A0A098QSB5_9SPIO|nr:hypothetical protein DC28_14190 [Spirochaeta lutea]
MMAGSLIMSACSDSETRALDLPVEELIVTRGRFGVIQPHYARIHEEADSSSRVVDLVRRGGVVELIEAAPFETLERGSVDYWYSVAYSIVLPNGSPQSREGWIFGQDLVLFTTRARAQNASAQLGDGVYGHE